MTDKNISLESLLEARDQLINTINNDLSRNERNFLLSMKSGIPDYTLLPFPNIEQFPALQWKLINIKKMDGTKHSLMMNKLRAVLKI